jgi:lysophospholipase L1-like esterase
LKTSNFGDGDRNSFTISRTAEQHLNNTDLLVMYVGVNDLFTTQNTLTRKQREAKIMARSTAETGLAGFARNSRLITGAALLLRAVPDPAGETVADVPLPDATENHQMLVDSAHKHGSQIVFMTEHVQSWQLPNLEVYSRMQQKIAREHAHAHWVDAGAAFDGMSDSTTLVDSNHLSRSGNRILGEHLAAQLSPLLFDQGSSL